MRDELVSFVLPDALVVSGVCSILENKERVFLSENTLREAPCVEAE